MEVHKFWGKKWHGYFNFDLHWTGPGDIPAHGWGARCGWWSNFVFVASLSLFPPHVIIRLPGLFLEFCWPVDARPIWEKGRA